VSTRVVRYLELAELMAYYPRAYLLKLSGCNAAFRPNEQERWMEYLKRQRCGGALGERAGSADEETRQNLTPAMVPRARLSPRGVIKVVSLGY
jgi:hypothetical protein